MSPELHLHEEIVLLALNDETGAFHWKTYLPAIAGAVVAELMLQGRIEVERHVVGAAVDRAERHADDVDSERVQVPVPPPSRYSP